MTKATVQEKPLTGKQAIMWRGLTRGAKVKIAKPVIKLETNGATYFKAEWTK